MQIKLDPVAQFLCQGRLEVVIGAGYRPYEFQMFGKRREDRKDLYINTFSFLRKAWSGETFEYEGRSITITPKPQPAPEVRERAAEASAAVADDSLRRALEALGANVLSRQKD